ncbi:zinc ribbon domain-containing protein [Thermosynechococcus sichuanensis E542]|uniref:Zinc ribbon domain-containing protein n=1 Tax=Thermosynechococcus sichuanensis E542 TaxID=2016101 RepID=A0A3B7MA30_9CYAN|nr:zinc ribbon domain-containing protein [Thermosynechococcus vestitus]AXY67483.1 zinc ribbon domain-containing protein [Thermosynechococcus vestitus E542]
MPLYEFRCSTCGIFEEWRSLAQSSEPAFCPECQQLGRRIFSVPAVNLSSSLPRPSRGSEPELVQRSPQKPKPPRFQQQSCGRPWMLNH